jgi:hypothetical protein
MSSLWGAPVPSPVVFGVLAENSVDFRATYVFGEGAKDNTRGRVCSPPMNPCKIAVPAVV